MDLLKVAGFYYEDLDQETKQDYCNARFEVGSEDGLDIAEKFSTESVRQKSINRFRII